MVANSKNCICFVVQKIAKFRRTYDTTIGFYFLMYFFDVQEGKNIYGDNACITRLSRS